MPSLDEIYTREWFEKDFADLQPEFDVVADSLVRQFGLDGLNVIDVGCGPGMIVRRLREHGVEAWGVDGSTHALGYAHEDVRDYLKLADVTVPGLFVELIGSNIDLVVCTEVLEHIDESSADDVVRLLTSFMCPLVVTAAGIGQEGHHHVNCQPSKYWTTKFEARGCILDQSATEDLEFRWSGLKRLSHMTSNVMVFT